MSEIEKKAIVDALTNAEKRLDKVFQGKDSLPPSSIANAMLLRNLKIQRNCFVGILAACLSLCVYMAFQNHTWRKKALTVEKILLPYHIAAPNFVRVRAGVMQKELVFQFVDDFLTRWGNINYDDMENKGDDLARYMGPSMKARFKKAFRDKAKRFSLLKIDQIAKFERARRYDRKQEMVGLTEKTVYTVRVWGRIRRYYEGREQNPQRIRVTIRMTTTVLAGDKSWLFDVLDVKAQTEQEVNDEKKITH